MKRQINRKKINGKKTGPGKAPGKKEKRPQSRPVIRSKNPEYAVRAFNRAYLRAIKQSNAEIKKQIIAHEQLIEELKTRPKTTLVQRLLNMQIMELQAYKSALSKKPEKSILKYPKKKPGWKQ